MSWIVKQKKRVCVELIFRTSLVISGGNGDVESHIRDLIKPYLRYLLERCEGEERNLIPFLPFNFSPVKDTLNLATMVDLHFKLERERCYLMQVFLVIFGVATNVRD